MRRSAVVVAVVAIVAALLFVAFRGASGPATMDERVRSVAAGLRCPVCQNLSVADSPSPLAEEMRARIERELRAGRTPEEIRREFVNAYGEWILLAPPKRGIDLLAWVVPLLAVIALAAGAAFAVKRWTGWRSSTDERRADDELSPHDRELLHRALATTSAEEQP